MLLGLALAVAAQVAACQPVHADHLYGRDLAAAVPALSALPPEEAVSLAPIPGQRRVFHPNELERVARGHGIAGEIDGEACFEWTRSLPQAADVLTAMKASLEASKATIEIVALPANPIPNGVIAFPLTGISGYSDGPVIWHGSVTYAPNRSLPMWARVRIVAHERDLVAAHTLPPGVPITAADLKTEDYAGPFRHEKYVSDPQQVIGLMPRASIPAGAPLNERMLREAAAVERGDAVQVIVQLDRTRIETQGIAEEGGARGSLIEIRNAKSGRKYRARVEDKDKVLVLPTSLAGLAVEEPKS